MIKNKILILGGKGMLGTEITMLLRSNFEVLSVDRETVDITDKQQSENFIVAEQPEWIINCAAMTAVDACESNESQAMQVNGYALEYIGLAAKTAGSKVIHISTDYVFNGQNPSGYREDDLKDPINIYGKSKAVGEDLLLQSHPTGAYVFRTAWLYGKNGKNFVTTMLDLASKGQSIKVVQDQTGSPTYTKDLAGVIKDFLQKDYNAGIYHVVNSGETSWFGFAQKIFEEKGLSVEVIPVSSDEFPRPAKRPAYSILQNTKLPKLRPWEEALVDYLCG